MSTVKGTPAPGRGPGTATPDAAPSAPEAATAMPDATTAAPSTAPSPGAPHLPPSRDGGSGDAPRPLLPTATPRRTRAAARELTRPHRWRALAAVAVFAGEAAAGLAGPFALGRIVDTVREGGTSGAVVGAALVLLGAAFVQALLTATGAGLVARVGEGALARLREQVVARALALPAQRVEEAGTGDLAARIG
ncbi:ABC transporter transmembrane domain-containing protein, partial [Streptomyces sp. SPB074]|uniref:ABC transporter transmembrane domain-containing protein n=1 Tax=Streptomyces sp. (strain SPB074) TaxID=465543 RepID=UPI00055D40D8